jgi:anti-sigma B factor antagonist
VAFAVKNPFAFTGVHAETCRHMSQEYIITRIDKASVIEFRLPSLMDPLQLESIGQDLNKLVDEEDRRILVLDFSKVEYLSSQAIGIVIGLHRKLSALPNSKLLLCGVNAKLMQLLKITRLDRVLTLKPTQKEAINSLALV